MTSVTLAKPRLPATLSGRIGAALVVLTVFLALFGPWIAPHSPDVTFAAPYGPPSAKALLGTDFLGRDVLSRALSGGRSVLLFALIATVAAYIGGLLIGLAAGHVRGWLDPVLMRSVDVLLAFPALVFILLVTTGLGKGVSALLFATALIQLPPIARIVRTATLEQSLRSYVEAAVARGERTSEIMRREVLPNISRTLSADVGLRFTWSVLLIASVNFLGLGLQPPASDWGLMISENRGGIALNPYAILAPAVLLAMLTIGINLVSDELSGGKGEQ